MSETMLELRGLNKTFYPGTINANHVLKDLSLTLAAGDFVTVIGSNGAGKSTLFGAIAGTFLPDSGQVRLDDRDITFLPEHKRALSMGRIFQDTNKGTAPGMTIEENLALAYLRNGGRRSIMGITKADRDFFRQQLAQLGLGLEDRLTAKVGLLSGGQRQAVALLMSTMTTPKLLLLDEHTAALDPATAEKVLAITRQIVEEKKLTCMMITHNIQSALTLGNRTLMMDRGQVVLDIAGTERREMTVPQLLERFRQQTDRALFNDRMLLEN